MASVFQTLPSFRNFKTDGDMCLRFSKGKAVASTMQKAWGHRRLSSLNLDSPPVDRVVLTCGQGGPHLWSGWYCVLHNHRAGGGSAVCPDEPQGLTYMGNAAAGRAPQNLEGHPRLALETLLPSGPSLTFLSWTHYRDHPACPGELSSPSLKPSLPGQVALVNPSLSGPQSPGNRVSWAGLEWASQARQFTGITWEPGWRWHLASTPCESGLSDLGCGLNFRVVKAFQVTPVVIWGGSHGALEPHHSALMGITRSDQRCRHCSHTLTGISAISQDPQGFMWAEAGAAQG